MARERRPAHEEGSGTKGSGELPHRHSIRLPEYDYSGGGACFVTVCTQGMACLFGEVVAGGLLLNDAGHMIREVWEEIPVHCAGIGIDQFVVMPNHVHGVVIIGGDGGGMSLPDVVHRFKTMTTKRYADGVKRQGWRPFCGKLWQRNYWEYVVRNEPELARIREYIHNNPARWSSDDEALSSHH